MNTCTGCGAPIEERTRGCRICSNRHNKWRRAGDKRALRPPDPETCNKCGGPYLTRNRGCHSCGHRHDYWLRRGTREESPARGKSAKAAAATSTRTPTGAKSAPDGNVRENAEPLRHRKRKEPHRHLRLLQNSSTAHTPP